MADEVQKSVGRILTSLDAIALRRQSLKQLANTCRSGMESIETELQNIEKEDTQAVKISHPQSDGPGVWYVVGTDNIGAEIIPVLLMADSPQDGPLLQWFMSPNGTGYTILNSNYGYLVWNDETGKLETVVTRPAKLWSITKNHGGYKIVWNSDKLLRLGASPDWYMDPYPDVVSNNVLTEAQAHSFRIKIASGVDWAP